MLFTAHKNGKKVLIEVPEKPIYRSKPSEELPIDLIYGCDSESLFSRETGNLQTVSIPFYAGLKEECLTYEQIKNYQNPFEAFVDVVFQRHSVPEKGELRPSNTCMRGEYGKRRPGRHKVPFILFVWYNLEYDIARMFAPESNFWRGVKTGHDGIKLQLEHYELEIRHHLLFGSAPHFNYLFRRDGRILNIKALDMWGYWKAGLDKTAKALGLEGKDEFDNDIFDIPLEDLTQEQWADLYKYSKIDGRRTKEIYIETAKLLSHISPAVFTQGILPPSAPKAAVRICFSNLKNEVLFPAPNFAIQMALDGYHGGYVYALKKGYIVRVTVVDRKSAYPTNMQLLPNPETVSYIKIKKDTIFESLIGKVGFVVASFSESHQSFPVTSLFGDDGRTLHPWGDFERVTISIPELAIGVLMGSVTNVIIHSGFYLKGEQGGIFYDYINEMFEIKNNSESKSPTYQIAKLMLNSPCGKLIEIHDEESPLIFDSDLDLIVPANDDPEFKKDLLSAYANEDMLQFEELCEKNRNGLFTTFGEFLSSDICTVGSYFMPVYASLITALQRAWVILMSRTLNGIAGDTDSVFTEEDLNDPVIKARLIKADILARKVGIGVICEGNNLGDYEVELQNGSGWISGIKQYYLENPSGKDKCAHHTLIKPDLDFSDIKHLPKEEQGELMIARRMAFFKQAIQRLSNGEDISYTGASSPVKLKTSLQRGKDFGVFEKQPREIKAKHDDRLREVSPGVFVWKSIDEIQDLLESED